jgi:hypothetical protein
MDDFCFQTDLIGVLDFYGDKFESHFDSIRRFIYFAFEGFNFSGSTGTS